MPGERKGSEGVAEGAWGEGEEAGVDAEPGDLEARGETDALEEAGLAGRSDLAAGTRPGAATMKSASVCCPSSDLIFMECQAYQPAGSASAIAA